MLQDHHFSREEKAVTARILEWLLNLVDFFKEAARRQCSLGTLIWHSAPVSLLTLYRQMLLICHPY